MLIPQAKEETEVMGTVLKNILLSVLSLAHKMI
jgi:hypothetical protein